MSWSRRRSSPSPTASVGRPTLIRLQHRSVYCSPPTTPSGSQPVSTCGKQRLPSSLPPLTTTRPISALPSSSAVQSINSGFGSGIIAGDTGILLNNRMSYWHLDPGHPNYLRPGRRVRHTMNPPLVLKDGVLWSVFGTPGADNQVQVNLQVLTAMIDFGLDP